MDKCVRRAEYINKIRQGFNTSPIVALLGPRQCGKTTLAREYFSLQKGSKEQYFDLENPLDLTHLEDPMLALENASGLSVIDEVQRSPELFPTLRVLVDQKQKHRQFLILGSASRELLRQSSESLAGRIHYIELTPFSFEETQNLEKLWLRGGFPLSYLTKSEEMSATWRKDYIRTYLEQDIPNLGFNIPPAHLRRFWMMLAHYHGQLFNASELGNTLSLSHNTIRKYLDILTGTFMIRRLPPWFENIRKRQIKSPKIYFRDSGIYHTLMNINSKEELITNPKLGASWEGFALESAIRHMNVDPADCYFWATHNQAELDLLIAIGHQRLGFEFKYTKMPKLTRSMTISCEDLGLESLTVIYAGDRKFKLADKITCIPLKAFLTTKSPL